MMEDGLTLQEAAECVGLSIDTLRYYERAGLLKGVVRTIGGQRRYDQANLNGIIFVTKMRATGMPIRRIREYFEAEVQPDGTCPERRTIMVEHRQSVIEKIAELNDALGLIEKKIAMFDMNTLGCTPNHTVSQRVLESV